MSDGIPDELRGWVDEHRAILDRVARETPDQLDALREQYTDELTALLAPYEEGPAQLRMEVRAEPMALLAGRPAVHAPELSLHIDEARVTIIRPLA